MDEQDLVILDLGNYISSNPIPPKYSESDIDPNLCIVPAKYSPPHPSRENFMVNTDGYFAGYRMEVGDIFYLCAEHSRDLRNVASSGKDHQPWMLNRPLLDT